MNLDIKKELTKIILNSKIKNTYSIKYGNSRYTLDHIIDELIYVLKSGVSWRNVRSVINYKTLFWHFNNLSKNHIFHKLFYKIKRKYFKILNYPNVNYLLIDSTIIYNKFGINKIGRNKFYKNKNSTKISLLTDSCGIPLSIFFMKGNFHDNTIFHKHINDITIHFPKRKYKILADKGYSCTKNYEFLNENKLEHIIPPRKNMKIHDSYIYDKEEYKKRIKIEHIFARLKLFKKIEVRNEKFLRNYSSFTFLAFSILSVNIIHKHINISLY
jgi:transposase